MSEQYLQLKHLYGSMLLYKQRNTVCTTISFKFHLHILIHVIGYKT